MRYFATLPFIYSLVDRRAGITLDDDVSFEIAFDDRHVIMVGRKSRRLRRRDVALADLIDEPWVLPPPDTPAGSYIASAFRTAGREPPRAQVLTFSVPMHLHLLATGRFITTLPLSMVGHAGHLSLRLLTIRACGSPNTPRTGSSGRKPGNRYASSSRRRFVEVTRIRPPTPPLTAPRHHPRFASAIRAPAETYKAVIHGGSTPTFAWNPPTRLHEDPSIDVFVYPFNFSVTAVVVTSSEK